MLAFPMPGFTYGLHNELHLLQLSVPMVWGFQSVIRFLKAIIRNHIQYCVILCSDYVRVSYKVSYRTKHYLPDDSALTKDYQADLEKGLQEAKDPSLTAKFIVSFLARASTNIALSDDKPQLIFLPQEYCDCSESLAADEDYYYFLECVHHHVQTTMPQKATAAKLRKEIYSTRKATPEQAKSDACAHMSSYKHLGWTCIRVSHMVDAGQTVASAPR